MDALGLRIMERVAEMDDAEKLQVLDYLHQNSRKNWSFEAWMEQVESLQARVRSQQQLNKIFRVQDLLDEVREERLNDLMGRP
jgi:hypothetical protein